VYAVNTNGTDFTTLHSFTATSTNSSGLYTNSDGVAPQGGLILSGNTLYGTAQYGGSSGFGTVYAVNTNGTGFTNLHSFTALSVAYFGTNNDGANPWAGLILSGNTLYGTAANGGSLARGTVFSISLPLPQLTIIRSAANVILTWPAEAAGFNLRSAPAVTGAFTNIVPAATSPFTNAITGTQQFYRLSQ